MRIRYWIEMFVGPCWIDVNINFHEALIQEGGWHRKRPKPIPVCEITYIHSNSLRSEQNIRNCTLYLTILNPLNYFERFPGKSTVMILIIMNTEMILRRFEETSNINRNQLSRPGLEKCWRTDSATSHIYVRFKIILQLALNKESVLIRLMEFPGNQSLFTVCHKSIQR
jgi:hypothetical protein